MPSQPYDMTVIGGGIVGLATAMTLMELRPKAQVALLEKEKHLGRHQTGHNSGVIHSGVYYRPGSQKAAFCVGGARALIDFCDRHGIRTERCGKVIVALRAEEFPRLEELHRRAVVNGVAGTALLHAEQLREMEPHAVGLRALHVPSTAIVDFSEVANAYATEFQQAGGTLKTDCQVRRLTQHDRTVHLETTQGPIQSRRVINCAGLYADRFLKGSARRELQILPFRGEYYELIPERRSLVRHLIYPVPDPRFPFLGVHFTRRIDGRVEAGPNAVLALDREGYRWSDINLADCARMLAFPGFWRMAGRYAPIGVQEVLRSWSKKRFVRDLQQLVPDIEEKDLIPSEAGVRAQAVRSDGTLLDDFHFVSEGQLLHVCNAPSPAATASLAIGRRIAETALEGFGL